MPIVYDELRRLARQFLARQRRNHTLSTTALVHEAYLRLVDCNTVHWDNRAQFFGLAAQLMRQVLVDSARKRNAVKRKANALTLTFEDIAAPQGKDEVDLIALDRALEGLAALDARQAHIVELRYFAGLSIEDTSRVLGLSAATVKREWATARTWLYQELS